jgi:hypothetical protein
MSCVAPEFFERATREDHSDDPALAVDGLSDFWPSQTTLDMESALAVGTLGDLFPGRDADADAISYLGIADDYDAPATGGESVADTPVDDGLTIDDEICESEQVFESGHIFQSDIQRAAMEFQRFAEKFHAFAAECQDKVT